ncbi:hypothetical protein LCGC14_2993160 [marine sediment metagenome]|uniref:Uncharacterized protein n=1 Tax=marine sediment metagenome TaxID=412755 RepID=A0A0F8ZAQ7_9ZZZZ
MDEKLEVTQMLDVVEHDSERAEQEAREEEDLLLFGMEFDECPADREYKRLVAEDTWVERVKAAQLQRVGY